MYEGYGNPPSSSLVLWVACHSPHVLAFSFPFPPFSLLQIGVFGCHGQGSNQGWMYSTNHELRTPDSLCVDVWSSNFPTDVSIQRCHQAKGNQEFLIEGSTIRHVATNGCLAVMTIGGEKVLKLTVCQPGNPEQSWTWQ
eukprot:m.42428 g.42428  ORF g.42428 m.42428 type:complete len:139 (+) comp11920_c0_seq1:39-455(+)